MRATTLEPRRDPVMRVATRSSVRTIPRRPTTYTQRPEPTLAEADLVQTACPAAELAVHDERQRLARELHDSVAQALYGISLSASRVGALLERGDAEQVR